MQARAFCAKKKLGQHFLVDEKALDSIVGALDLSPGDRVVEIGPGIGFLTRRLCAEGAVVTAVELDRESCSRLRSLDLPRLEVLHGDFLSFDIGEGRFVQRPGKESGAGEKDGRRFSEPDRSPLKIAGNIPYQITGLILGHIFGEIGARSPWLDLIERVVLTVQKEVALRMVAKPNSEHYAQVSILLRYAGEAEIVRILSEDSFFPRPKVQSAVVAVRPGGRIPIDCDDERLLGRVVRAGFSNRRKMLRNALVSLRLPEGAVDSAFRKLDMDPQVRAENLSLNQFAMLTNVLKAETLENESSQSRGGRKAESDV